MCLQKPPPVTYRAITGPDRVISRLPKVHRIGLLGPATDPNLDALLPPYHIRYAPRIEIGHALFENLLAGITLQQRFAEIRTQIPLPP